MFHLREPYSPPNIRSFSQPFVVTRVGFVEDVADIIAPFGSADNALSSSEIDEWSSSVEVDLGPASDEDVWLEEETKKVKKGKKAVPKPPSSTGIAALKTVQAALAKLGYDLGPKGVDGMIGPYTRAAIVKYKKDNGVAPADATINASFRASLDASVKKKVAGGTTPPPGGAAIASSGASWMMIAAAVAVVGVAAFFILR